VNQSFFEGWSHQIPEGAPGFRKSLSIVIVDSHATETARYNLSNCWPASWKLSTMESRGNDILIVEVVIAVERFEKA